MPNKRIEIKIKQKTEKMFLNQSLELKMRKKIIPAF